MNSCRIPNTDLVVSRIAYGCAQLASWSSAPLNLEDLSRAERLVSAAYDNGITFFDHADLYAFGRSETLFGRVLKRAPQLRNSIVIQSKCGQRIPRGWEPGRPIRIDLRHEHIIDSVEGSLGRLGIDRIDILLLHAADPLMEPDEVARAFDDLHKAGKVRYFGVSNHSPAQIELLKKSLHQPIVANQIQLSLAHPLPLLDGLEFTLQLTKGSSTGPVHTGASGTGTIDYCRLNDIQIQAWSPLRGVLNQSLDAPPTSTRVAQLLRELAKAEKVAPSSLALAWLLRHPAEIVPVIGPTKPEHITENCEAAVIELSRENWYSLFATISDP